LKELTIKECSSKTPKRLLDAVMGMSPDFKIDLSVPRTLMIQRIFFQTLEYFRKHSLVDSKVFGELFQKHGVILDVSKHCFVSGKYEQRLSNNFLPKSSKDFLDDWYHRSPFWNMLEGQP
jgi:hypothetical protein